MNKFLLVLFVAVAIFGLAGTVNARMINKQRTLSGQKKKSHLQRKHEYDNQIYHFDTWQNASKDWMNKMKTVREA